MILQYPDTAILPAKAENATVSGGIVIPGLKGDNLIIKGRYEPADVNREIFNIDGVDLKIKGIFYCPVKTQKIDNGSTISIVNKKEESILTEEKVLYFSRGQFNCRLFI